MKTNISESIKHSLLVEGDELGSLVEFIRSRYGKVQITAECSDNSELETDDISEIINFDNPNYRKIKNITINAHTSYEEILRLRIDSSSNFNMYMNSARLTITSLSDETAVYLSQEIPKRLREMKPGYDLLARFPLTFIAMIVAFLWMFAQGVGRFVGFIKLQPEPQSNVSWNDLSIVLVTFIVIVLALTYLLDKVQGILFPRVFFLIGKQRRSLESLKKWRMIVLTAVILGVASSLVASFIFQWLQAK